MHLVFIGTFYFILARHVTLVLSDGKQNRFQVGAIDIDYRHRFLSSQLRRHLGSCTD